MGADDVSDEDSRGPLACDRCLEADAVCVPQDVVGAAACARCRKRKVKCSFASLSVREGGRSTSGAPRVLSTIVLPRLSAPAMARNPSSSDGAESSFGVARLFLPDDSEGGRNAM